MSNPYEAMARMTVPQILRGTAMQTIAFVVIGTALWIISGRQLEHFLSLDLNQIGMGFALGIAMIALATTLAWAFPRYAEFIARAQAKNFAFLGKRLSLPAIIFISICAGIGEEALFRGGIQTLLGDYAPIPVAIVISAIVFTLVHFSKPVIALHIFAIGCLFGVIYWQTGGLLALMIAHTLYDIFALWALQRMMQRLGLSETQAKHGPAEAKPSQSLDVQEPSG